MAFLYCRHCSNIMTLLTNMVFTGVFNFWCCIPLWEQACSQSWFHFLNFLIQVIVLCKPSYASFTLTLLNPTKILSWLVAYWHALNITRPKKIPSWTLSKFKGSQSTSDYIIATIIVKLLPSSFKKVITWCNNPYFSNKV